MLKNIPIQKKLMMVIIMISGAVLVLTCTAFFAYELHTFRESTERQLSTLGEIIAANSTGALAFDSPGDAEEILSALKAEKHIEAAILYDKEGKLFSKYPVSFIPDAQNIVPDSKGYHFTTTHLEGFEPVIQGTVRLGTLYLKSDLKAVKERFTLYLVVIISVITISLLLAYLLSKVLQKNISRPILSLAETASAISDRHDYSVRAVKHGNDELGLLTDAFNHMLMRIQDQNNALSEFNKNLEQKVSERTAELEKANQEQKEAQKEIYWKNLELAQALEELQSTQDQLVELNEALEHRVNERTNRLLVRENELIEKNSELKKINIDLDNFVYTASHDLKAPISNIEGLSIMLNKRLNGRLSEEEIHLMGLIGKSILKFKDTIQALTEITKVQRNLESDEEIISIEELINDVKNDIQDMILESKASISVELNVVSLLYGHYNLRSILYNLISNAIKYRSPNRLITIEIKTYTDGGFIVLSMQDNGLGINEENKHKVFNMFKRFHTHVEGTGIGLYIIKRIIENKGGRIELESVLDQGSLFKVFFKNNLQ